PSKGNEAGRMSRRFVIVPFNNPVTTQQSNLAKHIEQNLAAYIALCARAYNILGRKYGSSDLFRSAPSFFREQACGQFIQSNSLALFMNSSAFVRGEQYATPWTLIEEAAKTEAGFTGAKEMTNNLRDVYGRQNICNALGLTLSKGPETRFDKLTQTEYCCFWVEGIALKSVLDKAAAEGMTA
uniref:hypothetical protein n=1 Tax=Asticcacaulis sp. TaxID=1872648 RepID=UPI00262C75C2